MNNKNPLHLSIPPRWMTYEQASRYCGLSIGTLQNYHKSGLIRVAKVIQPGAKRGRNLVDLDSLNKYLESFVTPSEYRYTVQEFIQAIQRLNKRGEQISAEQLNLELETPI